MPNPNWEYYVQVAEYVRLFPIAQYRGLEMGFEDELMDLTLREGERLLVCCEVKVNEIEMKNLVNKMKKYEPKIDRTADDRGNDPLRKAKYIDEHKPEYFYLLAIGARMEFRVEYISGKVFQLTPDTIPFIRD